MRQVTQLALFPNQETVKTIGSKHNQLLIPCLLSAKSEVKTEVKTEVEAKPPAKFKTEVVEFDGLKILIEKRDGKETAKLI